MFVMFGNPWQAAKKYLKRSGSLWVGAQVCERMGMDGAALSLVRRAIETEQDCLDLRTLAGRLCYKMGLIDDAIAHLQFVWPCGWEGGGHGIERCMNKKAGTLSHDSGWMLAAMGSWLRQKGEPARALSFIDRALSTGYRDSVVLNQKGLSLLALGAEEEALRFFQEARFIGGKNPSVLLNMGLSLNRLGRYSEALKHYELAQRMGNNEVSVLNNKGFSLYNLRRYEEAAACFAMAREFDPGDDTVVANLAACYFKVGRVGEGKDLLMGLIIKNPNDSELKNSLAFALEATGEKQKALELYQGAAALDGQENVVYLLNQAAFLVELGRYDDALALCTRISGTAPGDRRVWSLKASILAELGQESEAADCYRQALGLTG